MDEVPEPFVCPNCFMVSYHPKDKEHGYCGLCHDWTAVPEREGADCD